MGPREAKQGGREPPAADIRFTTLLYRFWFFDWLFADMTRARNLFERNAAWQHNRRMRRHLPVYLRRWAALAALAFAFGYLSDQVLETSLVAAWFFSWSVVTLVGMVVISVLWMFLAQPEAS